MSPWGRVFLENARFAANGDFQPGALNLIWWLTHQYGANKRALINQHLIWLWRP